MIHFLSVGYLFAVTVAEGGCKIPAAGAANPLQWASGIVSAMTTTTVPDTTNTPLERFYCAVERGLPIDAGVFTNDVVLDATVPMWRFHRRGAADTAAEVGRWYADAGHFEEFQTFALPGGALVEFVLTWEQQGVPHACHQTHRLDLDGDGRIRGLHVWCGGRWPANLLAEMGQAEMEQAEQASGAQQ